MADVDNSAWDGPAAMSAAASADDPAAALNAICAGKKEGDPKTEAAHALPHHKAPGDPPNAAGVRNAEARISQTQGLTNEAAAQKHLDAHMATIQAAEKSTSNVKELRAAALASGQLIPGGRERTRPFSSQMRMKLVQKEGRNLYEVEGYATVFNRGYEMWDAFGAYTEIMDQAALDRSMAAAPDVAFLTNHRGVTMARTTNGSLVLERDNVGLHCLAYLNADRQDVRDLASAIGDGLVDEMSFAFMLNDGMWNDEMTEFRIMEADINRGDVSAVNYGANPFTSIQARSADWLADIDRMPEMVAKTAVERIQARFAALGPAPEPEPEPEPEPIPEPIPEPVERMGKSVKIWKMRFNF
jgi:HK97 family phage prohead protease